MNIELIQKSQENENKEGQCLNDNKNNSFGWVHLCWLLKNLSVGVGYGQRNCQATLLDEWKITKNK